MKVNAGNRSLGILKPYPDLSWECLNKTRLHPKALGQSKINPRNGTKEDSRLNRIDITKLINLHEAGQWTLQT
ncbi:hypothetical protein Y1Q_0019635 [Alligator mississippiensis]|uniref:Uncharacterized protein n=1 Tax=Alligator mississippiensis TaxID=8496 RepID=A0A151PEG4_ALLMI|nr:hypothetical protein Y1Q_0019635 [Alligator mississippiensis]